MEDFSEHSFDVKTIDRIICIMSFTSSASCLMSSLLDNHPNILSFPDNVISSFSEFWKEFNSLPLDQLLDEFLNKYTTIFDARTVPNEYKGKAERGDARGFMNLGPERNEYLKVDKISFCKYMKVFIGDSNNITRKLFFQAIHVAYAKALNRRVMNPIIVFGLHSLTQPGRIKALLEDFSDVYFLTMVRHPLNATGSRLRSQIRNGIGISHFHRIITGISGAGAIDPSTKNSSWRAVRMEDLHQFPKETMEHVSNWIELPWNKTLLESTINGKKWWNEKQGIQTSGFNRAIASQTFEDYLSKLDSIRLYIMLNRKCSAWNYKSPWWSNNFFSKLLVLPLLIAPFKIEIIAWSLMLKSIVNSKERFIMKIWLIFRMIIGGFGLGRIGVFRAWLNTIRGQQTEVKLLISGMRLADTINKYKK